MRPREPARDRHALAGHPDEAAPHPPFAEERGDDELHRVAGNGQRRAPAPAITTAVLTPTTEPAVVTSGPPELPGLSARIGLNDVLHQPPRTCPHRSTDCADDTGRHRVLKSQRVADCDDDLPRPERGRIAEADPRQRAGCRQSFILQDGKIGIGIQSDEFGQAARPIRQSDGQAARPFDDVAVGGDESVRGEHEPGSRSPRVHFDLDDRRTRPFDGVDDRARIAVEQIAIVGKAGGSMKPS